MATTNLGGNTECDFFKHQWCLLHNVSVPSDCPSWKQMCADCSQGWTTDDDRNSYRLEAEVTEAPKEWLIKIGVINNG